MGGYSLPDGLPEGAIVRVVDFDHGYNEVEFEGRRFKVFSGCAIQVPSEFGASENAAKFFRRIRQVLPSQIGRPCLTVSTQFKHLRFAVFSDHKPSGLLEVHKDAILNLGPEFADRVGRQLLAMACKKTA